MLRSTPNPSTDVFASFSAYSVYARISPDEVRRLMCVDSVRRSGVNLITRSQDCLSSTPLPTTLHLAVYIFDRVLAELLRRDPIKSGAFKAFDCLLIAYLTHTCHIT